MSAFQPQRDSACGAAARASLTATIALLATTLWQAAGAVFAPTLWLASHLTTDDTYLALQTARNWAALGFPTFDGIHRTNGFHPLWGLLLRALAAVIQEPIGLLRATLLLAAGLHLLTGLLLMRFCRRVEPGRPALALVVAACWSAYGLSGAPAMIGLENALLPTLVAALLLVIARMRGGAGGAGGVREGCLFGLLCSALIWTRLDALVLLPFAGLAAFGRTRRMAPPLVAAAIFAAGAIGYASFQYWANRTLTPVSGQVKRTIAKQIEPDWTVATAATALRDAANVVLKHATIGLGMIRPRGLSSAVRFVLLALIVLTFCRESPQRVWFALAAAALLAHALVVRLWLGAYFHDALWYYSATNVLAALGVPLLLFALLGHRTRAVRAITAGACVLFAARLAYSCWLFTAAPPPSSYAPDRLAAAAWLRENVPPDERVAAWNAGELAYFSGRTVVNLDGLVNDAAFLREIVTAGGSIEAYLDRNRVDWLADFERDALAGGGAYWKVAPRDTWTVAARIGNTDETRMLIVRRAARGLTSAPAR